MTRDEHNQIIQQLLNCVAADHQATASNLLLQLSEDYEEFTTNLETLTQHNTKLSNDFEELRKVNSKLFLRVGETEKVSSQNIPTPKDGEPEEDIPTYESLFNEKGELK